MKRKTYFNLFLLLIVLSFVITAVFYYRKPYISIISPSRVLIGSRVVLKGKYFGRESGSISINNVFLTSKNLLSWRDDEIIFILYNHLDSGVLYIKNKYGKSNEVFLVIDSQIPLSVGRTKKPYLIPKIDLTLTPANFITLEGDFLLGNSLERKIILNTNSESLEVLDSNILSWTDNKISFIVPKNLKYSGSINLSIGEQNTSPIFYKYNSGPITFNFLDEKTYNVSQVFDISFRNEEKNFNTYFFFFAPREDERQKVLKTTLNNRNFKSKTLLKSLPLKTNTRQTLSFKVKVSALKVEIPSDFNFSPLSIEENLHYSAYLSYKGNYLGEGSNLDFSVLKIENTKNPYQKALSIFNSLKAYFTFDESIKTLEESLKIAKISRENLIKLVNILFYKAEIPLKTAVGLYEEEILKEHNWFEFFLKDIGWLYFDIISAIENKQSNLLYFKDISNSYILYGYLEDLPFYFQREYNLKFESKKSYYYKIKDNLTVNTSFNFNKG